jgi:hypothetical protein
MERRWLLDPMHIEVNITKSLLRNVYGTRDNLSVRRDCQKAGMHRRSWPKIGQDGKPKRVRREDTSWILDKEVRKAMNALFCSTRFPTKYGAKLRNCCNPRNAKEPPHGLKSHDYHKIMQHVLPIALRACDQNARTKRLREAIYEMSAIFRYVYSSFKCASAIVNCL